MPRRLNTDRNTRLLFDLAGGKSKAITLPIETCRAFKWETGQKFTLTIDEKKQRITIEAKADAPRTNNG
jgi:hypothetical protein